MARIKSKPTKGLTYNPTDAKYWDREALDAELERAYDICHGCRLCHNLCPSFPALFDAVDEHDGEVRELSREQADEVVDLCYGCKLCHVKCPYTPEENHEFQLDFPRLMLRARAVTAREWGGPKLRDRVLGNPDLVGKIATKTAKLANWGNGVRLQRLTMEAVLGVHRDKDLPDFAAETFTAWVERTGAVKPASNATAKVALFHTCFIEYNDPEPGKAVLKVLQKNGCDVNVPEQNCCGMPALDSGNIEFATRQAHQNVKQLLPHVEDGRRIAAINPTCSMMMRKEYPNLFSGADQEDAKKVAAAMVDPHELLFELHKNDQLNHDFKTPQGKIAYHVPCHLKAQNIGFRSRDILKLIPETEVELVDACTAHDGTWAMKKEFFALSSQWGDKAFQGMRGVVGADRFATDCPLAAIQIRQFTGVPTVHPAQILLDAYGDDE